MHLSMNQKTNSAYQSNNLMVTLNSKVGNNNGVLIKQDNYSPNMRNIMLNQPLTQSMNQAYIGGVGGHTSEFPITQNNLSTALQQNSKINVMTSQHHATPRSVYNLSFDSDNTLDNNEHDFTIPESVPQTARILSLNQRFNSPQPKDSLLSPNPEGTNPGLQSSLKFPSHQKLSYINYAVSPNSKIEDIQQNDPWGERIIQFLDHLQYSQSTLSNMIYNKIKSALPFSTIILPDRHIVLPCIVMKHPLTICGTPGTILEIVNGNVICDFREFLKENPSINLFIKFFRIVSYQKQINLFKASNNCSKALSSYAQIEIWNILQFQKQMNEPLIGRPTKVVEARLYDVASRFDRSRFDSISRTTLQVLRSLMLVILIGIYLASFFMQPFYVHYVYVTYWALHFSFIALLLSMTAATDKHNLSLREWSLITTELKQERQINIIPKFIIFIIQLKLAMTLTIVSALFYWAIVRDDLYQNYDWGIKQDKYFIIFLSFLHLGPLFITFFNFLLSDVSFLTRDVGLIILFGIAYVIFNFLVSKLSGVPIYPFITWYNVKSFVSAIVFILVLGGIYMFLVAFSSVLPRKEVHYHHDPDSRINL